MKATWLVYAFGGVKDVSLNGHIRSERYVDSSVATAERPVGERLTHMSKETNSSRFKNGERNMGRQKPKPEAEDR